MTAPQIPDSQGWMGDPRRGAALGRIDKTPSPPDQSPKFYLSRIRLDAGGYDSGGAYWGHYQRLYWACSEDSQTEKFFRAHDRADAKAELRKTFPQARFFR